MELVLPNNYIALEEEEMMYLNGEGWIADSFAAGGAIVGHGVKHSLVGAAIRLAGGWVANQINAAIVVAMMNPAGAALALGGLVGLGGAVYLIGRNQRWW
ncbi:hypothetical protein [Streptococcus ruminantium]|uniref:hypothetical protein n=1 Tax=Streptococcus ruminantium TaxID=1917441 RepID=UPI0012DCB168|nr:hypothetical protein [Streptococcus ruminantium]